MRKPCVACDKTGVVVEWNINDDSGDSVVICTECGGDGYVNA